MGCSIYIGLIACMTRLNDIFGIHVGFIYYMTSHILCALHHKYQKIFLSFFCAVYIAISDTWFIIHTNKLAWSTYIVPLVYICDNFPFLFYLVYNILHSYWYWYTETLFPDINSPYLSTLGLIYAGLLAPVGIVFPLPIWNEVHSLISQHCVLELLWVRITGVSLSFPTVMIFCIHWIP